MKILVRWKWPMQSQHEIMSTFAGMELSEYQAQWGPSMKVLGRWHDPASRHGLAVVETTDAAALANVFMGWNHLVDVEMSIVHDDAETHVLAREFVKSQG
jgi:hypothetical protein